MYYRNAHPEKLKIFNALQHNCPRKKKAFDW